VIVFILIAHDIAPSCIHGRLFFESILRLFTPAQFPRPRRSIFVKPASSFRDIDSIQVSVEERRILIESTGADNWHTQTYSSLESVPEILPPSFGVADAAQHEVNLHSLIRQLSGEKRQHATFQLPYTDAPAGEEKHGSTVLRTIDIHLTYKSHS
jgi:hypothetical protein